MHSSSNCHAQPVVVAVLNIHAKLNKFSCTKSPHVLGMSAFGLSITTLTCTMGASREMSQLWRYVTPP